MCFAFRRSLFNSSLIHVPLLSLANSKPASFLTRYLAMTSSNRASLPFQQDETTLLRPVTAGIPQNSTSSKDGDTELVFFSTFFCPFAQMVWIAINEKGAQDKTEFVEGLTIRGSGYEIHPRLQALGGSSVPTLYHPATESVVAGSTPCVTFVDQHFGTEPTLIPKNMKDKLMAEGCEDLLHSVFTLSFHGMLLHQDPQDQEEDKEKLLWAIEELLEQYTGPYYLGEQFSVADIALAPYFDHMVALEHYRNFYVPKEGPTAKWHEWRAATLQRPSVAATRQDHERIIESYKRYAKCYVRNNMYKRVFGIKP